MSWKVHVIVTANRIGTAGVVPYNKEEGLQYYVTPTGHRTARLVIYDVPVYEVRIEKGASYQAIRFGLRKRGDSTPTTRGCDAGLSHNRVCTPSWVPGYSPHSFHGSSRRGAWRLLPGKNFLIHEGGDRRVRQVGGSIGCVEVLDGRWDAFLTEIETIGGSDCAQLSARQHVKVTLEHASFPDARLR